MGWFNPKRHDRKHDPPENHRDVPQTYQRNSSSDKRIHKSPKPIHEQLHDVNYDNSETTGTYDEFLYDENYWRPLNNNSSAKDMVPSTYLDFHTQCYEAYTVNPLAFSIIELTTSFVLGEGLTVSAVHPRVQQVIDAFWHHPENHMEERVYTLCTELSLYGEVFIRFFVNPYDGTVVVRHIDPSLIDQIETDGEDIEKPLRYHRVALQEVNAGLDSGQWFQAGREVMHVTINKVSNAKRGRSDLAPLLPWLRRYREWLSDRVLVNRLKTSFVWDVTLTGADKKTLDRRRIEYAAPPEPGSVIIHNESEKWSAVEPKIQSADAAEDGRALKLMIAAGAMLPEHYLSDGDNGNRATAAEMSLPTLLKFKRRQRVLKYMLRQIIDRVISEAQQAGRLGSRINTKYGIVFPEIDSSEQETLAQSAQALVQALSTAKSQGWISDETAMGMLFKFAGEEINIYDEIQRVEAQRQRKEQQ